MDNLTIADLTVNPDIDLMQILIRFLINFAASFVIVRCLYFPKSHRREYFVTFLLIAVSTYMLTSLLGSANIKIGFALGLFAIFGIIRYRTEQIAVREMTYLFVIIALSVINSLATGLSYGELGGVDLLMIAAIVICERAPLSGSLASRSVTYDRIDLIRPERRSELIDDLSRRLGIEVVDVEVGSVDFLRDTASITVRYRKDRYMK